MFNIYRENKQACDHIGCCADSGYSVERVDTGAFISVCAEHATSYGSRTWSRDYNNVEYTSEKPSQTVLGNDTPRPFFSESEIKLDII